MAGLFFQQYSKLSVPIPLANLKLWLKADAGITLNGSNVSVWADQSGNGNDVTQSNAINQPTFSANQLNGKPIIYFDGNSKFMSNSGIILNSNKITVFYVSELFFDVADATFYSIGNNIGITPCHYSVCAAYKYAIGYYGNNGYNQYNIATKPSGYLYMMNTVDISLSTRESVMAINGAVKGIADGNWAFNSNNSNAFTTNPLTLGFVNGYGTYGKFKIAEIIIYNDILSSIDKTTVNNYLAAKYSI